MGDALANKLAEGLGGFVEKMVAEDIHLGLGEKPYCVVCGDPFPCRTSIERGVDADTST